MTATSDYLNRPLRSLDAALAELTAGHPVTDDDALDRLLKAAGALHAAAEAMLPLVSYEARQEIRAFADLLHDALGDTLRAYRKAEIEREEDAQPYTRPGRIPA